MKTFGTVICIVLALAAGIFFLPTLVRPRVESSANACLNNLRRIQSLKERWARENRKSAGDTPTETDLFPSGGRDAMPLCPAGGVYVIGPVGEQPSCSIGPPAHALPPRGK
jgi:hypothetical protein